MIVLIILIVLLLIVSAILLLKLLDNYSLSAGFSEEGKK